MGRWFWNALMLAAMFAAVVAILDSARLAATESRAGAASSGRNAIDAIQNDPAVLSADRAFVAAVAAKDNAALDRLLDANFTWTGARGNTLTRAQVLASLPTSGIPNETGANIKEYTYGQVAVVEANLERMHVLRVWVDRPAGWRQLDYQEVESLAQPPASAPGSGQACINPCKTVPYKPRNAAESGVIRGYLALESAAVANNTAGFDRVTAAEFAAASSNSNRMMDKPTRMAELRSHKMAGLSPTPLASARMYDFPGVVVMISLHKPAGRGDPLYVTRVWIQKRDHWVETLSYQTSIQPAKASARKKLHRAA
jgi:Domain of unknown function (DUF4440)